MHLIKIILYIYYKKMYAQSIYEQFVFSFLYAYTRVFKKLHFCSQNKHVYENVLFTIVEKIQNTFVFVQMFRFS